MPLIVLPLWHGPDFVASIVNPASRGFGRRDVLALVLGIHEKIGMFVENHLHKAAAELRHKCKLQPIIGHLLRSPAVEACCMDITAGMHRRVLCNKGHCKHEWHECPDSQIEVMALHQMDQTKVPELLFDLYSSGDSFLSRTGRYCQQIPG